MRNIVIAVSFVLVLGMNVPYASAEAAPGGPVDSENAEAVRQGAKELGQMFGVEAPAEPKSEPAPQTKSVADVMDKAVDKIAGVVGTMSKALEDIAPDVWRIMLKQQYAKAVMNLVFPLGCVIVILLYMRYVGKYWRPDSEDSAQLDPNGPNEWELRMALVRIVPTIVLCLVGLWFFHDLSYSISFLINPEFYAIQDLLRMILNKGV